MKVTWLCFGAGLLSLVLDALNQCRAQLNLKSVKEVYLNLLNNAKNRNMQCVEGTNMSLKIIVTSLT